MIKPKKMSEKSCFKTAITFAVLAAVSAALMVCVHFSGVSEGSGGIGSVIAFYAISAAKLAVLCFLAAVTLFFSVISTVFSVKTVKDNEGVVRFYGILLCALSAASALFGATVTTVTVLYMTNFKI